MKKMLFGKTQGIETLVKKTQSWPRTLLRLLLVMTAAALILPVAATGFAADTQTASASTTTNSVPASASAPAKAEETNNSASQELRVYLQLQEQLHATQLAVERIRKETVELAAQNNETLSTRLQAIEQSISAQRARELDAMQSSNRVMLTVAGAFAGMGFLAMVLMGYFQWKTVKGLAEVSTTLPNIPLQLGMGRMPAALGPGTGGGADHHLHAVSPAVEQANPALLESIQRLEKRLRDLEHPAVAIDPMTAATTTTITSTATHTVPDATAITGAPAEPANGHDAPPAPRPNGSADAQTTNDAANVTSLLTRGQSLLNTEKAEEALACFDNVLAIEPNHADALVKKGTALEKLRKLHEAIDCYDRAIAADGNLTIAYLYKGGVFNRMERFSEALACYEQALKTQEKRRA